MTPVGDVFVRSASSARSLSRDTLAKPSTAHCPLQTARSAASSALGPIPAPQWPKASSNYADSFQLHKRVNAGFMVHPMQTHTSAELRDYYADTESRTVLEGTSEYGKQKGVFSNYLNEALKSGPMFIKPRRRGGR